MYTDLPTITIKASRGKRYNTTHNKLLKYSILLLHAKAMQHLPLRRLIQKTLLIHYT